MNKEKIMDYINQIKDEFKCWNVSIEAKEKINNILNNIKEEVEK